MEKSTFPDIILKRDNYEEWRQLILRKLNKTPMMLTWIQGNQDEEMDFTVILFQTHVVRTQEVAEPGTGGWWGGRKRAHSSSLYGGGA
jgi:hypothetical protein